jgi:hypothetical protein
VEVAPGTSNYILFDAQPGAAERGRLKAHIQCGFSALATTLERCLDVVLQRLTCHTEGRPVKKVALALALVVAGLSLGGCFVGKGKAPAPIVTKG